MRPVSEVVVKIKSQRQLIRGRTSHYRTSRINNLATKRVFHFTASAGDKKKFRNSEALWNVSKCITRIQNTMSPWPPTASQN